MRLDEHLAAAARSGVPPFVLVAVDGGETYWHRRASGDDPERMILDEVRPRLAEMGLRTSRLALMGWSMGGYGALLAARRHPEVVVATAASSPARRAVPAPTPTGTTSWRAEMLLRHLLSRRLRLPLTARSPVTPIRTRRPASGPASPR
jgi:enterochelin esterase-like enzyme